MDKSPVGLEQHQCPVCGKLHAVGVLIHKRLVKKFDEPVVTGMSLCPQHRKMFEQGYLALVGVSNAPTNGKGTLIASEAILTGSVAHLRRSSIYNVFKDVEISDTTEFVYVDQDVITALEALQRACNNQGELH